MTFWGFMVKTPRNLKLISFIKKIINNNYQRKISLWQYLTNQPENANSTSHTSFCPLSKEDKCNRFPYLNASRTHICFMGVRLAVISSGNVRRKAPGVEDRTHGLQNSDMTELWCWFEALLLRAVIHICLLLPLKVIFHIIKSKSLIIKILFIDYLLVDDVRVPRRSLEKKTSCSPALVLQNITWIFHLRFGNIIGADRINQPPYYFYH